MALFTKVVSSPLETELQIVSARHGFTPRIRRVDGASVQMDAVRGSCLAVLYSDDPEEVPGWIWSEIHRILAVLFEREGIEYVDITPYNFILEQDTDKIWIIDFGHAYYTEKKDGVAKNWFLRDVLGGEKRWNPDFA